MEKRDYNPKEKREVLALVLASTHYLNKRIPEHWKFMEEKEILDFIEKNIWIPFEGQDAETVYSNMKRLAQDFEDYGNYCAAQEADLRIIVSGE